MASWCCSVVEVTVGWSTLLGTVLGCEASGIELRGRDEAKVVVVALVRELVVVASGIAREDWPSGA